MANGSRESFCLDDFFVHFFYRAQPKRIPSFLPPRINSFRRCNTKHHFCLCKGFDSRLMGSTSESIRARRNNRLFFHFVSFLRSLSFSLSLPQSEGSQLKRDIRTECVVCSIVQRVIGKPNLNHIGLGDYFFSVAPTM